jgi:hypothetical protein
MKRNLIVAIITISVVGTSLYCYCNKYVFIAELFFRIPLSHPTAPINELFIPDNRMTQAGGLTWVATDIKGRIYVLGAKNHKACVVIIDREGRIERTVNLRLKDGRFLKHPCHFSVSPCGNRFWTCTAEVSRNKWLGKRIIVHNRNGEAEAEWKLKSEVWLLVASSGNSAYAFNPSYNEVFKFVVNNKKPQKFNIPFLAVFVFKEDSFWFISELDFLNRKIGKSENGKDWIGIAKWTPGKKMQIIGCFKKKSFKFTRKIRWIDEKGNFYGYSYGIIPLKEFLPSWLKEWSFLQKILVYLRLHDRYIELPKTLLIFSPERKSSEVIPLPRVIHSVSGEKLKYGDLVKVDDRGIYLEVEKVNEPREYRIVRIVKKRQWQVWWEALRSWFSPAYPRGKVTY